MYELNSTYLRAAICAAVACFGASVCTAPDPSPLKLPSRPDCDSAPRFDIMAGIKGRGARGAQAKGASIAGWVRAGGDVFRDALAGAEQYDVAVLSCAPSPFDSVTSVDRRALVVAERLSMASRMEGGR